MLENLKSASRFESI